MYVLFTIDAMYNNKRIVSRIHTAFLSTASSLNAILTGNVLNCSETVRSACLLYGVLFIACT